MWGPENQEAFQLKEKWILFCVFAKKLIYYEAE
jgi:hypothetical protein